MSESEVRDWPERRDEEREEPSRLGPADLTYRALGKVSQGRHRDHRFERGPGDDGSLLQAVRSDHIFVAMGSD